MSDRILIPPYTHSPQYRNFFHLSSGCEVGVSILQGSMRAGRGVGLASAAGSATVKKILDLSMESVSSLSAGQKGTVTLLDRSVKCDIFVYGAVCRQFLVMTQLVCCTTLRMFCLSSQYVGLCW